ncbi:MAG: single-stranded DNA-binding protein [Candidatus Colwellbacteria bacterium]|nr:single-stranded DNA-binding protein [Candidatus Colwellbacteria bacterium]
MNLNKVFIIGRLTADPQIRTTPSGTEVATFGVATNRTWTDKNGGKKEEAEFHNVVVWGKQAGIVNQFLNKGSVIFIEGRIQTRSWEGKDGQPRKTTEIIAERIQLGPRTTGGPSRGDKFESGQKSEAKEEMPVIDLDTEEIKPEDIPF